MGAKNKKIPLKKILETARTSLVPTAHEIAAGEAVMAEMLHKVNTLIKPVKAIIGGSGAKKTYLRGGFDVDIFILFPYKQFVSKNADLSDWLETKLRKGFRDLTRIHGSRDYFRITHREVKFELIPILQIEKASQAVNITDISPLHSKWVSKRAKKGIHDEIRLTKGFCKGIGVYGAESHISGFSGYVCEILTIHYKSFLGVLKASKKWRPGDVIDTEKLLKGKPAFAVLNTSKLQSPIIVIDPVQMERNAAAALDLDAFGRFKQKAKEFLANPSADYFERKYWTAGELRKKYKKVGILSILPLDRKEDVAGSKLHKAFERIEEKIKESGFSLKEADWEWDHNGPALMWFVAKKEPLDATYLHQGPPIKIAEHAARFKRQYKKTLIKGGKVYAVVKREHRTIESLLTALVKEDILLKDLARTYSIF